MTRNLYLGADLGPAIGTPSIPALVTAAGEILRQVTATNFPVRAKGLADEIREKNPDLVGLQEVALWRTGPPNPAALQGVKTATTVRYDFLQLLLDELNHGPDRYQPVVIEEEFDFEAPADENGIPGDGPPATPQYDISNAELNGRLTMRDVILERVDAGVHVWNPQGGHFQHLLPLPIVGAQIPVTRGWTEIDARVRGSLPFHFVNTHLEAFDPASLVPSIRALQAGELVAPGGPATSTLPVVLVGDLNSDDDTVAPGDRQAYLVLLNAGLVERSTNDPLSCCIEGSYDLTTGSVTDFDHQVDHVMTSAPDTVKLVLSSVTGRTMHNGYWDSDHAGIFSALYIH
jgi:endonuclease/exonuclease/phosphatase family metal-dependent hydrolase